MTSLMPASTIFSVQGGVFPQWEHGSRLTYIVALLAFLPADLMALISACSSPTFLCHPLPTILPLFTMTQPTSGLGETEPFPFSASSRAISMYFLCDIIQPTIPNCNGKI